MLGELTMAMSCSGRFYRHADVLAAPSLYESFYLPLRRWRSGCPVIVVGGLPEAYGEGAYVL